MMISSNQNPLRNLWIHSVLIGKLLIKNQRTKIMDQVEVTNLRRQIITVQRLTVVLTGKLTTLSHNPIVSTHFLSVHLRNHQHLTMHHLQAILKNVFRMPKPYQVINSSTEIRMYVCDHYIWIKFTYHTHLILLHVHPSKNNWKTDIILFSTLANSCFFFNKNNVHVLI